MKSIKVVLCITVGNLLFFFNVVFGQIPSPTPIIIEENDVVKITTSIIQLDVNVTDRKGKTVTGLTAEDFEVYENGRLQKITGLRFISKFIEEKTVKAANNDIISPPRPLRPEQIRRTFALVVDDLSLSFESIYRTRRALRRFVDQNMQEGDLVAIIRTGGGVGALQQFTNDKRILYSAIEKIKWNSRGRAGVGTFAIAERAPMETLSALGDSTISLEDINDEKNYLRELEDFRSTFYTSGSLGALRFIVGGMKDLPGRKSVVLFSDGFPQLELDRTGTTSSGRISSFLESLIEEANRSSVVFYALDPRGLVYTGTTAADSIKPPVTDIRRIHETLNQITAERNNILEESQGSLRILAEETGGFAHLNNNSLNMGLDRVLEDHSYYLIAYEPNDETFDSSKIKFNKIEVKLKNPDLMVRSRSGFFNLSDKDKSSSSLVPISPAQKLSDALMSPFSVNEVLLNMYPVISKGANNVAVIKPILHIDTQNFKFIDKENSRKNLNITVAASLYGDNGSVIESFGRKFDLSLDEKQIALLDMRGLIYEFQMPIKKEGAFQLRVAIMDTNSNLVGSANEFIEIPNFKKNQITISSLVLTQSSVDEWNSLLKGDAGNYGLNSLADSSIRIFNRNSVLSYGYEIYNPRTNSARRPDLTTKLRIFHEGKLILDGNEQPVDLSLQKDMQRIGVTSAIKLAEAMQPGDYVLQIIVTDKLAKGKSRIATRHIDFEVIE